MVSVPAIKRVGPGDIKPFRSAVQVATEARGFDVAGKALTNLGSAIQSEGAALAQIGIVNQRRDNLREIDARMLRFREGSWNLRYGNEAEGIVGYSTLKGQNAIDAKPAFDKALAALELSSGEGASNSDVTEAFALRAQAHTLEAQAHHATHLATQRMVAESATDRAVIQQDINEIISNPLILSEDGEWVINPDNSTLEQDIVIRTLATADRDGLTDPQVRISLIETALTTLHKAVIKSLLDKGDAVPGAGVTAAWAYYRFNETEILQNERGALIKSLRLGSISHDAHLEVEQISKTTSNHVDRLAEVRLIPDVEVREKALIIMRAKNSDETTAIVAQQKQLKSAALKLAHGGVIVEKMPPEIRNALYGFDPGLIKTLDTIAENAKAGRPNASVEKVVGRLFDMQRNTPKAFAAEDLTTGMGLKLSAADWEYFTKQQQEIDTMNAAEAKTANTLAKARAATKNFVFTNIKKDDYEKLAMFDRGLADFIESAIKEGRVLTDADFMTRARNLLSTRVPTDTGWFGTKYVRLYEALGRNYRISTTTPKEFIDENEKNFERLSTELNIAPDELAPLWLAVIQSEMSGSEREDVKGLLIPEKILIHKAAIDAANPAISRDVFMARNAQLITGIMTATEISDRRGIATVVQALSRGDPARNIPPRPATAKAVQAEYARQIKEQRARAVTAAVTDEEPPVVPVVPEVVPDEVTETDLAKMRGDIVVPPVGLQHPDVADAEEKVLAAQARLDELQAEQEQAKRERIERAEQQAAIAVSDAERQELVEREELEAIIEASEAERERLIAAGESTVLAERSMNRAIKAIIDREAAAAAKQASRAEAKEIRSAAQAANKAAAQQATQRAAAETALQTAKNAVAIAEITALYENLELPVPKEVNRVRTHPRLIREAERIQRKQARDVNAEAAKIIRRQETQAINNRILNLIKKKSVSEQPPEEAVPDEQELKEREEREAEIATSEAERARLIAAGEPAVMAELRAQAANEELIIEQEQITSDEGGNVAKTYPDKVVQPDGSIKLVPTGGVGHRLTAAELKLYPIGTSIPQSVRDAWFEQDMKTAVADATSLLPKNVPPEVFSIVVNMAFNMGKPTLSGFGGMFTAIRAADYDRAALEMEWTNPDAARRVHTPWFLQTGGRSKRLISRMKRVI